ncbi:hypothetical protein [Nonomuraea sp. CA-141351]|uniref:hypothetical protein n=1 Tax=Nonomuraea sp. CA-141351 TaxID=3239996 RepID=UPI003D9424C6
MLVIVHSLQTIRDADQIVAVRIYNVKALGLPTIRPRLRALQGSLRWMTASRQRPHDHPPGSARAAGAWPAA